MKKGCVFHRATGCLEKFMNSAELSWTWAPDMPCARCGCAMALLSWSGQSHGAWDEWNSHIKDLTISPMIEKVCFSKN